MLRNDPVQILIDHFNKTSWPINLNEQKVRDRSSVTLNNESGCGQIVEIERHRPILGAQYAKGLPMAAFETYFMRYAITKSGDDVTELAERSSSADCDANAIADEYTGYERVSLGVIKKGEKYKIFDSVSNNREIVMTKEEAQRFGREIADSAIDEFTSHFRFGATKCLTDVQRNELVGNVSNSIYKRIASLVDTAWNDPDED